MRGASEHWTRAFDASLPRMRATRAAATRTAGVEWLVQDVIAGDDA
jgi:hypothetical protein